MPAGNKKSRTFRKIFKRTPGGKNVIHYEKRKPKSPKCSVCGKQLIGIPRLSDKKLQKTAKSKKRPERPYGGRLCGSCLKVKLIKEVRS
ncbi:50S ribosomal protein L34e [Candidatus Woesearchaeota archaeon]|jgi:large subunit ribosomal protein L34e|nr:50S ribosomal protein L34e [Candidatus Woesearchaeota archaeon]|tara:strand:- start:379 stop:645 length:267 start_codon:yes stop_codon:yes gene_type:complete